MPRRYWEDWALGIWVADVRNAGRQQWLTPSQMCLLEESQFPFKVYGVCECHYISCQRTLVGNKEEYDIYVHLTKLLIIVDMTI